MRTTRWLRDSLPKNAAKLSGLWLDVLRVCDEKQLVFMRRVLRVFAIDNARRTSSKQVLRMDPDRWDTEVSLSSLFQWAYSGLTALRPDGLEPETAERLDKQYNKLMENFLDGPPTLVC